MLVSGVPLKVSFLYDYAFGNNEWLSLYFEYWRLIQMDYSPLSAEKGKKKDTLVLSDTSISPLSSTTNNQIVSRVKDKAGH